MSLFKKAKSTKMVDYNDNIVYDFILRAPFWSYRTVPYREYEPFVSFIPVIDGFLEKQFRGEIDSGNGDTLDNMICDMARQAEKDLDKQRSEHTDMIKSFDIRYHGDRKAFEHELTLLSAEFAEIEQQQAEINARLKKDKFIGGNKNA